MTTSTTLDTINLVRTHLAVAASQAGIAILEAPELGRIEAALTFLADEAVQLRHDLAEMVSTLCELDNENAALHDQLANAYGS